MTRFSIDINDELKRELLALDNPKIYYLPTPGNGGDSLITMGTIDFFNEIGLKYSPTTVEGVEQIADGSVLILGGGGNLVPIYGHAKRMLLTYGKRAERIILLPHTIRGHDAVIAGLGPNVTLFARDETSYEHVRKNATGGCVAKLGHDMAFHADPRPLIEDQSPEYLAAFQKQCWKHKFDAAAMVDREVARYMRTDKEMTDASANGDGDISAVFSLGSSVELYKKSAWCMFHVLSMPKTIVTDRLHVGIGAMLINKKCTIHDNSYGKNSSLFAHSLAGKDTSLEFVPFGG